MEILVNVIITYYSNIGIPEPNLRTIPIYSGPYGVVEITSIDTVNKVVSGNFDAILYPATYNGGDTTVFSGEFENIVYGILVL